MTNNNQLITELNFRIEIQFVLNFEMRSTDYWLLFTTVHWKNYWNFFVIIFILPPNDFVEFQINRLAIDAIDDTLNESFRCKKKKKMFFRFTNRSTKQNKTQLGQKKQQNANIVFIRVK